MSKALPLEGCGEMLGTFYVKKTAFFLLQIGDTKAH